VQPDENDEKLSVSLEVKPDNSPTISEDPEKTINVHHSVVPSVLSAAAPVSFANCSHLLFVVDAYSNFV
jgi:hypothetical protein